MQIPILATGPCADGRRSPCRGFTLVELLIALVLIGVMTGMAMLAMGNDGRAGRQANEARRLSTLLQMAELEAELQGRALGLELFTHSYRFLALNASGWVDYHDDDLFRAHALDTGLKLSLRIDGDERTLNLAAPQASSSQPVPHIVLLPDDMSQRVMIRLTGSDETLIITNDGPDGWQVERSDTAS